MGHIPGLLSPPYVPCSTVVLTAHRNTFKGCLLIGFLLVRAELSVRAHLPLPILQKGQRKMRSLMQPKTYAASTGAF